VFTHMLRPQICSRDYITDCVSSRDVCQKNILSMDRTHAPYKDRLLQDSMRCPDMRNYYIGMLVLLTG